MVVLWYSHMAIKNPSTKSKRTTKLEKEVGRLRSALVSLIGEDHEGAYRPQLVRKLLKEASETPTKTFTSPNAFLDDINGV